MNKKEEIIKGAKTLFTQYGLKKVSMDEIAKISGVTKKTIYSYFKDKNELIKYFIYEEIDNMKSIVNKIDEKDLSPTDKTQEMIYTLLEYRKENQLLKKISEESELFQTKTAKECEEIFTKSIITEIKKLLDRGIANKDIKKCDTCLASFIIYKMYVAIMYEWDKELNKKEVTNNILNILKSGIFN